MKSFTSTIAFFSLMLTLLSRNVDASSHDVHILMHETGEANEIDASNVLDQANPIAGDKTFEGFGSKFKSGIEAVRATESEGLEEPDEAVDGQKVARELVAVATQTDSCCTTTRNFTVATITVCLGQSEKDARFTVNTDDYGMIKPVNRTMEPWKDYPYVNGKAYTARCNCGPIGCMCPRTCINFEYTSSVGPLAGAMRFTSENNLRGLVATGGECSGVPNLPELSACQGYVKERTVVFGPMSDTCVALNSTAIPTNGTSRVKLSCLYKKQKFPTLQEKNYNDCKEYDRLAAKFGEELGGPKHVINFASKVAQAFNCSGGPIYADGTNLPVEYCEAAKRMLTAITSPGGACYTLANAARRDLRGSNMGVELGWNRQLSGGTVGCKGNPYECSQVSSCKASTSICETDPHASAIGSAAVGVVASKIVETFLANEIRGMAVGGFMFLVAVDIPAIVAFAVAAGIGLAIEEATGAAIEYVGESICKGLVGQCLSDAKTQLGLDCRGIGCCPKGETCAWPCSACTSEPKFPTKPFVCDAAHSTSRCGTCVHSDVKGDSTCLGATKSAPYFTYEIVDCLCPKADCGVAVSCSQGGCPFYPAKQCSDILTY